MDRIIVSVSELTKKVNELNQDGYSDAEISYLSEDEMPDGEFIPASLHFAVFDDYSEIDYDGIESAIEYKDVEVAEDFENIIVSTKELKQMTNQMESDSQKFVELVYYPSKEISNDKISPASLRFLAFDPELPNKRFDFGYLPASYDE